MGEVQQGGFLRLWQICLSLFLIPPSLDAWDRWHGWRALKWRGKEA